MSRTTDALKRLFGKSGCYTDAQGVKHPLPDDMKFLKSFFRGRVVEKVVDEGAKAFDSERFDTPFPEYIDELILGHDSAGKLTSATAMTSKDNAIDCAITVHDYYGSLYVANGKTSSSIGEWLGVTSTDRFSEWHLNLVDTRAGVPQITNWSSSRSQVNGGFEATVYYGSDKANKQIYLCCEKDGMKGIIEVNDTMLYHLFEEAPISIVNDFSNLVDKMKLPETWTLDGTFQYLKTKSGESSAVLDLDWMHGKWKNLNGSISIDGDAQTLGIIFPENLDAVVDDLPVCTIGSVLTTASCDDLANKLKTLEAGSSKTIRFESPSYAANLSAEAKATIEGKNWILDGIAEPIHYLACDFNGNLVRSSDGINWSPISQDVIHSNIYGGCYADGKFVVVGSAGVFYSIDGIDWVSAGKPFGSTAVLSVAYGNGKFVVGSATGKYAYSEDLTNWTAGTFAYNVFTAESIAFGVNRFVGGLAGALTYSDDGITWNPISQSVFESAGVTFVTYGNGRFVGGDADGKLGYSEDGVSWTASSNTVFSSEEVKAIAWGLDGFIAVGGKGTIAYSSDGITWTAASSGLGDKALSAIAAGNDKFIVGSKSGDLIYSLNGVNWISLVSAPLSNAVKSLMYKE